MNWARGQAFLSTAWITINILRPKAPTGTFYGCILTEAMPLAILWNLQKTASGILEKQDGAAPSRIESCIRQIMELYSKKDITTEVLSAQLITSILTEFILRRNAGTGSASRRRRPFPRRYPDPARHPGGGTLYQQAFSGAAASG